jgi:hypothetical protein
VSIRGCPGLGLVEMCASGGGVHQGMSRVGGQ